MDWRERALCRFEDPDLFFPIGNLDSGPTLLQTEEAKAICRRCPTVQRCLEWAMATGKVEGIWAATTERERSAIRRRMAREAGSRSASAA